MAKTLFIVVVVFAALRVPFTILVVLREKYYDEDISVSSGMQLFWYISQYLMFLNAAVNPLIYGFNNENFRRAYNQISWVRRCRETAKQRGESDSSDHCCYCAFMKKGRAIKRAEEAEQSKNVEVESRELSTESYPTTKTTERVRNEPGDSLVPEIAADGFI